MGGAHVKQAIAQIPALEYKSRLGVIAGGNHRAVQSASVVFGRRATAEGFYTDWSNVWNRSDAGFNTRMMRRPSSLLRHGPTQFCCT